VFVTLVSVCLCAPAQMVFMCLSLPFPSFSCCLCVGTVLFDICAGKARSVASTLQRSTVLYSTTIVFKRGRHASLYVTVCLTRNVHHQCFPT
jgi:hypothetical protein